jgi:AraC-like DNA-binding protein
MEKNDEISIQNEQLEQLNLEYQKQAHTIIHHQNTILAKNRDLNRIIEHLSKIEDTDYQTLLTEIDHVVNTAKVVSSLIKVALYQCNDGTKCEEILASFAQLLHCTDENELIHYLPDFIIIDHNFKGHFNPQISHIPLIRIIPTDGLQNAFHQLADITIIESELQTALPKQIQMYTNRRHLINEQFASTPSTNSSDLTLHAADQEFIDTTILVIEKHLSNNELDSELLCHELNLSRTVLYSKIKQLTGQGVHEFIKMIRVKKSVDLLKARKLNITQIAYEVGFSSPSYYNRCFVKQFGVPPKEYLSKL